MFPITFPITFRSISRTGTFRNFVALRSFNFLRLRAGMIAILGFLMAALSGEASARKLAAPVRDMIEVRVVGLRADPLGAPVLLLQAPGAEPVLPVFIGPFEAEAILRALHGMSAPRPMTHDLLGSALRKSGARLTRVFIDDFSGGTYFGMLELRTGRLFGRTARVDSRPSDAIAIALRAGVPILVSPKVMEMAVGTEAPDGDASLSEWPGISVSNIDRDMRGVLGLPGLPGLLVTRAWGAAEAAGLRPGALLLEVNGAAPRSPGEFEERVGEIPYGGRLRLRYWQGGEEHEADLLRMPPREAGEEQRL